MWIRSQDRKKLTEIHDVTIYHDKQIWAGCSFIGEYSTEEKTLKVLDQIQYNMELFEHELTMVFQMPTDTEVDDGARFCVDREQIEFVGGNE